MAIVHFDRVKETTTTVGAGDRVLLGAAAGFRTFSAVCADGDLVPYAAAGGTEFEVGLGRYNTAANSITPLEIKASSNAGAIVAFSAGVKDVTMGPMAAHVRPIAPYPFTSATGLMWRWNAALSRTDLTPLGYAKKLYDISGNARHSDTNVTNPPKWNSRGFNWGYPCIYFNSGQRITVSALPGLGAPLTCTIIFLVHDVAGGGGNAHIYNWSGSPIGFGATSPLDFMYNGTLPAAHPVGAESVGNRSAEMTSYPVVGLHVFNSAASVQSLNNNEVVVNPGNSATGATNSFTIGGDSSTAGGSYAKFKLHEMAVLNFAASAGDRAKLLAYYTAMAGIVTP